MQGYWKWQAATKACFVFVVELRVSGVTGHCLQITIIRELKLTSVRNSNRDVKFEGRDPELGK